ncbi:HAD family hydrolase [Planctomicrobium sp. SH668]|uniref:HAD family hydrolase n=1 Tax=Planctomicrobium sp. SH668 TaxID=3448126 RepID=UPI003F5C37EA
MKTVCLFDIDGTLLDSGGAGQLAMEQALLDVFQVTGPYGDIPAAGRTDKAITTDLFNHHGLPVTDENWAVFLEAYLKHLPPSLSAKDGVVLPGIIDVLNALSSRDDVALGLLTGNLEVGARLKLQHYDIDHHFHFGGYGDTHFNRDEVAQLAYEAASRHLQFEIQKEKLWVIGDTPADIRCGRSIGAKVLAVGTGIFSMDELRSHQPDLLCESLAEVEYVVSELVK